MVYLQKKYQLMTTFVVALLTAIAIPLLPPLVNLVIGRSPTPLERVRIDAITVVGKEGFFRVGKSTQGRWWFIDFEAKALLLSGILRLMKNLPS
ncbi:hypothetical protein IQ264_14135 [Phormidium sp. LEGE 05292]|uniref:hypothetical protein n=1 Tax=[Phormidium] sp. LEGE 05292 TaxID=767427 RepID=UPI001881BF99|nr:hypothetical protein [Phormidium sp. LEGE 05292]MBE9226563.1 hypothetical protein [Phormidium sp. LEGE 05292]